MSTNRWLSILLRMTLNDVGNRLLRFHRDESGLSYSVSLLACIPLYAFLIAAFVQTALLLMAAIGTQHAAQMAGRAARVWFPADCSNAEKEMRIKLAAVNALTPFASGNQAHSDSSNSRDSVADHLYAEQFATHPDGELVSSDYLLTKRRYAESAVVVSWQRLDNRQLEVAVQYDAPIHVPGVGPFLATGEQRRLHWTRRMVATVTVSVQQPDQAMGIHYASPH